MQAKYLVQFPSFWVCYRCKSRYFLSLSLSSFGHSVLQRETSLKFEWNAHTHFQIFNPQLNSTQILPGTRLKMIHQRWRWLDMVNALISLETQNSDWKPSTDKNPWIYKPHVWNPPKDPFLRANQIPFSNNKPKSPNPYNTNGNLISKRTYKAKIEKLKREGK